MNDTAPTGQAAQDAAQARATDPDGASGASGASGPSAAPKWPTGLGRRLNNWAATHLTIYAGLWGALVASASFFYKDVLEPRTAPVNISLNLELKKIGAASPPKGSSGEQLVAVEMQLAATNPSSREIALLPNVWVAYGYKANVSALDAAAFAARLNARLGRHAARPSERYASTSAGVALAGGILLGDSRLKPNEKVVRRLVFHVPRNVYDVVEVWTAIPSSSQARKLVFDWRFENNEMVADVRYADPKRGRVPRDADGYFVDDRLELQQSSSRVALSLWE